MAGTVNRFHTIRAALKFATDRLEKAGVESPSLVAERLLEFVFKISRVELYLDPDRTTTKDQQTRIQEILDERCRHIPLQYLTGETEFWSLPFFVNRSVLIPRPETEILVEETLSRLDGTKKPRIIDVGTGSGCIAVSLAIEIQEAVVVATDISPDAVRIARTNARRNGVEDRVRILVGNQLDPFRLPGLFDAIVSNLPYISDSQFRDLQPEVRVYEPRIALDGGEDGLDHYRRLIGCAGQYLRSSGWLLLEVGNTGVDPVKQIIRNTLIYEDISHVDDLTGLGRVVLARRR